MPNRLRPSTRKALVLVLVVGASWCVVVLGLFGYEWAALRANQGGFTVGDRTARPFRKFAMPGIIRPSTVEAGVSRLGDDEEVIGFEVGGRVRAYRLGAFRDRSSHVVNDVLGEVPVTVAYCDISDCVSGYTGGEAARPLDVSVGGLHAGRGMVLEVGGSLYFQGSGTALSPGEGPAAIPLERLSPTRTTWGEWKRLHPSTDVYEGVR